MKLLQRYILGELVRVFLVLVVILTVMLVFVGLFREATERGLGPVRILQIMPFVVPSIRTAELRHSVGGVKHRTNRDSGS